MSSLNITAFANPRRWPLLGSIALATGFAIAWHTASRLGTGGVALLQHPSWQTGALLVTAIKLLVFGVLRVPRNWGLLLTFNDLVTLGKAASISSLCLLACSALRLPTLANPFDVLLLDWILTIFLIGSMQALVRLVDEWPIPSYLIPWSQARRKKAVIIAGTNDAGEALLRAIRRDPKLDYRALGFTTAQPDLLRTSIGGVPVLGMLNETCRLAVEHRVGEVLITAGEMSGGQTRELVDEGRQCGVQVKVLPSIEQLLRGTVDLRPRTVSIEDLLGRHPVELDLAELHRWIHNRVIMVTGSAGSIGSEICRQLLPFGPKRLVLVDRSENGQFFLERTLRPLAGGTELEVCIADLNDGLRMNSVFRTQRPEFVFHTAAYKHVPLMEAHPGEAIKNIVLATRGLADLAHQHDVQSFVMTSTDKAVNPTSVMGACKRVAELYVQALAAKSACRFVTVRFGNVLDSAGSVVPIFREQIARGGPVTVTDPHMTRYFMTIPEASQLVIQAGAMGKGGEIFVLDMGQPIAIVDLARDMIRLSGLRVGPDIEIEFVGQRPGEKLHEELHVDGEQQRATSHPKIMVAVGEQNKLATLRDCIDQLRGMTEGDTQVLLADLQKVVPQYRSVQKPADVGWRDAA